MFAFIATTLDNYDRFLKKILVSSGCVRLNTMIPRILQPVLLSCPEVKTSVSAPFLHQHVLGSQRGWGLWVSLLLECQWGRRRW